MTYEELTIGGKAICWAFALMPFGAGWLGEQFGRWLRRQYETRRERKLGIPHTPPTGKKRQVKNGHRFCP